jgi:hypothetical protein
MKYCVSAGGCTASADVGERSDKNMGTHINADGLFQSDKYPTCPPGKVPLSVKDATAQDLLWTYAQRRRAMDAEFSADLEDALMANGYQPPPAYDDKI